MSYLANKIVVVVVSVCDLKLNGEEGCNSFAGLIYPTAEHFELCRSRTPAVHVPSIPHRCHIRVDRVRCPSLIRRVTECN